MVLRFGLISDFIFESSILEASVDLIETKLVSFNRICGIYLNQVDCIDHSMIPIPIENKTHMRVNGKYNIKA